MTDKPTKTKAVTLLFFWLINSLVFLVVRSFVPDLLVIGNAFMSATTAAFMSGLLLAVAVMLVEPVFNVFKIKVNKESRWWLIYLFVNTEVIWLLGRLADFSGIGLASFWVAIILGIIVTPLQWKTWLGVEDRIS